MKTQKKLIKTVLLSMAWLLLSYGDVWSQNATMVATSPAAGGQAKTELTEQEKNQVEFLQLSITKAKGELENGVNNNSFSQSQIQSLKMKISEMESEVKLINASVSKTSAQPKAVTTESKQAVVVQPAQPVSKSNAPSSVQAYKSYQPTSSNPRINDLEYNILRLKAELEVGQLNNTLSISQVAEMKNAIQIAENQLMDARKIEKNSK